MLSSSSGPCWPATLTGTPGRPHSQGPPWVLGSAQSTPHATIRLHFFLVHPSRLLEEAAQKAVLFEEPIGRPQRLSRERPQRSRSRSVLAARVACAPEVPASRDGTRPGRPWRPGRLSLSGRGWSPALSGEPRGRCEGCQGGAQGPSRTTVECPAARGPPRSGVVRPRLEDTGGQRGLQWGHVTNGPVGRDRGQRVSGKGRGWGPAGRVSDTRRKQGIFRGGHLQRVQGKDPCPGAAKEVVQLQGLRRQKHILPQLWRPEVQSRRVLWAGSS